MTVYDTYIYNYQKNTLTSHAVTVGAPQMVRLEKKLNAEADGLTYPADNTMLVRCRCCDWIGNCRVTHVGDSPFVLISRSQDKGE